MSGPGVRIRHRMKRPAMAVVRFEGRKRPDLVIWDIRHLAPGREIRRVIHCSAWRLADSWLQPWYEHKGGL